VVRSSAWPEDVADGHEGQRAGEDGAGRVAQAVELEQAQAGGLDRALVASAHR
jgi:hypothetical protein